MVNGIPTDYFQLIIGLCQGCPISPYLFILYVDALSRALWVVTLEQALVLYELTLRVKPILHPFLDDFLVVDWVSTQNAFIFRRNLEKYCGASGQKVNLLKLALYFSGSAR